MGIEVGGLEGGGFSIFRCPGFLLYCMHVGGFICTFRVAEDRVV